MKLNIIITVLLLNSLFIFTQSIDEEQKKQNLGDFTMSNPSSPAFVLIGETPTSVYTPTNVKALALHVSNNFGENLSFEFSPYFLFHKKSKNRSYYKYIGMEKDPITGKIKQNPFSGFNTTTISLAYVDKEFESFDGKRKAYSLGMRTTLFRWYDKSKFENAEDLSEALLDIDPPFDLIAGLSESDDPVIIQKYQDSISSYYKDEKLKIQPVIDKFKKTEKPVFRLDASIAHSSMFSENNINASLLNRFGSWLTAQGSFILNKNATSEHNNYLNLLIIGRYIEDEFNKNDVGLIETNTYRDFGGKIDLEFGNISFGYEYISRNGTVNSSRSVGSINYAINKDLSITGGFGKDFEVTDNLVSIIGINWGFNIGNDSVKLND